MGCRANDDDDDDDDDDCYLHLVLTNSEGKSLHSQL